MMNILLQTAGMMRKYAGGAAALVVLGTVLAGIFEGVGILLIVPLLGAGGFLDGSRDAVPLIGPLLAGIRHWPAELLLPVLLASFVLVVACQSGLQRFVTVRSTEIVNRCGRQFRIELFEALQEARWSFHLRKRRADLLNAMTSEAARLQTGFALMLQAASALIFTVLQFGIALAISWQLTALVLACGAAVLLASRRQVRKANALGRLTTDLVQEYVAGVSEQLQGLKDIKGNAMEEGGRLWIRSITDRIRREQLAHVRLRSTTEAAYRIVSAALAAGFACAALLVLHTPPHALLTIFIIMTRLWPRITTLQTQAQQFASNAPGVASVLALLEESRRERESDVFATEPPFAGGFRTDGNAAAPDSGLPAARKHPPAGDTGEPGSPARNAAEVSPATAAPGSGSSVRAAAGASPAAESGSSAASGRRPDPASASPVLPVPSRSANGEAEEAGGRLRLERGIRLSGVVFGYETGGGRRALDGVDLFIPAGSATAIVGHSGAGKSTLADLIMGLIRPQEGTVLYDGRPLNGRMLHELRRSVGYVPQDPFLFGGSVLDNLRMACPGVTEEEAFEALRLAAADGFVSRLPRGIRTPVGDRGVRLSGGERQRIVLARAILKRPSLLILDEATSALDAESEQAILASLDRLRGSMTILVIAHRLSTIRGADQIVVLERGRVVQCGRYAALAAEGSGLFERMLRQQATGG